MLAQMNEAVTVALIATVPATISALAAWRNAAKAREQVTPGNGLKTAEMVEQLIADVRSLKSDMTYHVTVQHGRVPIPSEKEKI